MNLQKRDCSIKIEFCNVRAGWLQMHLCINGETLKFVSSYCLGDGFHALLERIYYLHPNSYDWDYSGDIVDSIKIMVPINEKNKTSSVFVPYRTSFDWDEEGGIINWEMEREPTLDKEFYLNITLGIHRDDTDEYKKYTVSYKEFCYALAKAYTELLKRQGINGFHESYLDRDINLRYLLFIKAIALDADDMINTNIDDKYSVFSDLNKELELLMFDM